MKNPKLICPFYFIGEDVRRSGVANFDSNNRLMNFNEKPNYLIKKSGWVNAGIYYVFNQKIINRIELFDDFANDLIPKLIEEKFKVF